MIRHKVAHVAASHGEHICMIVYATCEVITKGLEAPGIISIGLIVFGIVKLRAEWRDE